MSPVKIVLVGIGGYGSGYVRSLLSKAGSEAYSVVGAVDPYPEASGELGSIRAAGVPVYADLEQFYAVADADLAVISSPIQFHCRQTKLALSRGSHVLCEKPMCASPAEAYEMIAARDKAGKFVAIGYQLSFSASMLQLKQDIMNGVFGKPVRLKTLVLWPRSDGYYARGWAGRIRDKNGNLVMDSIANNATAHYIHNMFFVLGHARDSSAAPVAVQAELYRANPIETYDTAALRCVSASGAELLYYASHAVKDIYGPDFIYEFEKGVVTCNLRGGQGLTAAFADGTAKHYGYPEKEAEHDKLWQAIDAVRTGAPLPCGLETALSHTLCVDAMRQSAPDVALFPPDHVKRALFANGDEGNYVEGLADALQKCFEQNKLPAEIGLPWARAGKTVRL